MEPQQGPAQPKLPPVLCEILKRAGDRLADNRFLTHNLKVGDVTAEEISTARWALVYSNDIIHEMYDALVRTARLITVWREGIKVNDYLESLTLADCKALRCANELEYSFTPLHLRKSGPLDLQPPSVVE